MTIEEKAKRYDEAIEALQSLFAEKAIRHCDRVNIKDITNIFSELKESDDDKIRKSLAAYFAKFKPDDMWDDDFSFGDIVTWLEKQANTAIKWNENTEGNKPQKNHSVLMKTTHCIAEGEWKGDDSWLQYRWGSSINDREVLALIEFSDLEKQCEQKPADSIPEDFEKYVEHLLSLSDGEGHGSPAKVKEVSAELLRLANKQKPAWSEYDASLCTKIQGILSVCKSHSLLSPDLYKEMCDWLKSRKPHTQWKPSDEQMYNLLDATHCDCAFFDIEILKGLYDDLKKLREE